MSEMMRDESMTVEARRYLLKGQGVHEADGLAADLGYVQVRVKPFSEAGVDVWFYRHCDSPRGSHHVEFGRTGGEMLMLEGDAH